MVFSGICAEPDKVAPRHLSVATPRAVLRCTPHRGKLGSRLPSVAASEARLWKQEAGEQASHEHIHHHHISTTALTESPRPLARALVTSPTSIHANRKPSHAPSVPAKAFPHTALYTQNHGAAHICSQVSADQTLRQAARTSIVGRVSAESPAAGSPDDQARWTPLPQQPALARAPPPPPVPVTVPALLRRRTVSRVPSFASLDTVSSSEGPETPRGHYSPLPSPSHARTSSDSLSYLENTSRLRVPGVCVTCKREGANFPSCSLCGDAWCSRECRVQATRDHKHACPRRTMQPSVAVDSGSDGRYEQ